MTDISVRSFEAMHDSGGQFMIAAKRMEQRLDDLMARVRAMNWDSQSRQQYDQIQLRFNNAYTDLKGLLHEIGTRVDTIAGHHEDTERYLKDNVWGGAPS
jgi:WXG100 family type VII secretion target